MSWIAACSVDDLADDGDSFRVAVNPPVALFNSGGEFYATADTCTHAEFSLSEGYVEDCTVECPVHLATFSLKTGAALKLPATEPLQTYEVRVSGDLIEIEMP